MTRQATPPMAMIDVITLYEPWASWILWGWKTIETRLHARFAGLRGERIGIHAGLRFDSDWAVTAVRYLSVEQVTQMIFEARSKAGERMSAGRMLCTAMVTETRWLTRADSPLALCDCSGGDRFGIVLADVQPIEGHPEAKGHQGIWKWKAA